MRTESFSRRMVGEITRRIALVGVMVVAAGLATAQTPDEQTPAEEDVCSEAGIDGPLKGLCNAYCEAMDCDSDNPHASAKACGKVKENWERHADGDPLPCETVECPCWGATSNLWSTLDTQCTDTVFQDFSNATRIKVVSGCVPGAEAAETELFFDGTGDPNEGFKFCVSDLPGLTGPALQVTEDEAQQCISDIVNYPNY